MEKSRISESLLEFLKENQKTVNHVLKLSSGDEAPYNYPKPQIRQPPSMNGGASLSEVLEKMSELIELNKVTLQTIDLLDKRIKRMYAYMSSEKSASEQEEVPTEEGEKVEYTEEE